MAPQSTAEQRIHDAALRLFAERGATQLTISELADAAGVARGTVYNNVAEPEALLSRVLALVASEMEARAKQHLASVSDPAERLARGVHLLIRRAHDEPHWGRFLCRFALSEHALQALWTGMMMDEMQEAVKAGRYSLLPEQVRTAIGMIWGVVIAAIYLVLEGHRTFRDASRDAAEFVLRALGVTKKDAQRLAALAGS